MLFISPEYLFLFLPITLVIYFSLNRLKWVIAAKTWLVFSSLFFYSWWNISYLALIVSSMFINFAVGSVLSKGELTNGISKKSVLGLGVTFNLVLLGYYKYADFFIVNSNQFLGTHFHYLNLILPLAISFFTFQQIAYLVDSYEGQTKEYDFLNYALFVTFFPQLIAGPIVHHKEMIPQFQATRSKVLNYRNIAKGLFIFSMGLFKKVVIADSFVSLVRQGFDVAPSLTMLEGWVTALAYTMQLYYDFSGYTDMAIGAALMFNISLPINFFSPYKCLNIQQFWRQWHITLSRFLRDYLYIPLGGNRVGSLRINTNIMITFVLGGLWHGAGWTFVVWGALHGTGLVIHRWWQQVDVQLPRFLSWLITFVFVMIGWVFFRAKTCGDAMKIVEAMFSPDRLVLPQKLAGVLGSLQSFGVQFGVPFNTLHMNEFLYGALLGSFLVSVLARNSHQWLDKFRFSAGYAAWIVVLFIASFIFGAYLNVQSEFIYFQF